MRIKSFKLMGHSIKVAYLKRVIAPDGSMPYGICYVDLNRIEIATHSNAGTPYPEEFIQHTFFHELAHLLMAMMSKNDLFQDETFIDLLGGLLAQFEGSKK